MAYWREMPGGSSSAVNLHFSGIPIIIPSSGTIGNNGALSGITALPTTFSGGCYMYFPANAIEAGSAAGLYYVVMSSTTAGTIYNNVLDFATPAIPATPTAFATTGPGAYTQTTGAAITLLEYVLPGGTMGVNSVINNEAMFSYSNSGNAKTLKATFGGTTLQQYAPTATVSANWHCDIWNRGSLTSQGATPFNVAGHTAASAGAVINAAINTAADVTIQHTGQLANAADFIILQRSHIIMD